MERDGARSERPDHDGSLDVPALLLAGYFVALIAIVAALLLLPAIL